MPLKLDTPLQYLKGVGPYFATLLSKMGLHCLEDLLYLFPNHYLDRRQILPLSEAHPQKNAVVIGKVLLAGEVTLGRSQKKIYEVVFSDGTGQLSVKWFRYSLRYMKQEFKKDRLAILAGELQEYRGSKQMVHPEVEWQDPDEQQEGMASPGIVPIYPLTQGLTQRRLQAIFAQNLDALIETLQEHLPESILSSYSLLPLPQAFLEVHKPPANAILDLWNQKQSSAHRRLIFEEFFLFEIQLALKKKGYLEVKTLPLEARAEFAAQFEQALPFELTGAQKRSVEQILASLRSHKPMYRLLQGDVGSGKTVVAALACFVAAKEGFQACLMAPTEILAQQHFRNISELLAPFSISVGLLKSDLPAVQKEQTLLQIASGSISIAIGTHALIQPEVRFRQLVLAVIDEQHRFGVRQRAELAKKGNHPHLLVMTATPIPRTLAMTVYGDLDVSILNELPPGRQKIQTHLVWEKDRTKLYSFIKNQVQAGRQAYVVCPLVEESEERTLKDATGVFETLQTQVFPELKIGLLHGKMSGVEKSPVLDGFVSGTVQILVATTVVEVGVDVPNATIMVVEHAERFGLAQLHQLRGRVGRGAEKSYCFLLPSAARSLEARERLKILCESQDGFQIAEADLNLRGPGEFLGTRQSGLPDFRIAHILRDAAILEQARNEAFEWIEQDPTLAEPHSIEIRHALQRRQKGHFYWSEIA